MQKRLPRIVHRKPVGGGYLKYWIGIAYSFRGFFWQRTPGAYFLQNYFA